MNLIVDIGNTFVKVGVYCQGEILTQGQYVALMDKDLDELLGGRCAERAIVSSTRKKVEEISEVVKRHTLEMLIFDADTPVPILNDYLTPKTLGRDRLAAAVGALKLYPNRNLLVVDCGTAITIDLVTKDGCFRGGCISLGLSSRFEALHEYCQCLPLLEPSDKECLIGRTTHEAIEQGVLNSVQFEIEGYVERLSSEFDELCVIFTGGDAKFFVKRIKNAIFAECNLVFAGLDRILEYNVHKEQLD